MKTTRKIKFGFIAIGFAAIFTLVTMLLWNWLIPDIFKGPSISYIQAFGLIILAKLLFVLGPRENPLYLRKHFIRTHMYERWEKMTPEEREEWKKRCSHWRWDEWENEKTENKTSDKSV
jgi:hypothetical protein